MDGVPVNGASEQNRPLQFQALPKACVDPCPDDGTAGQEAVLITGLALTASRQPFLRHGLASPALASAVGMPLATH